jgi:hypothetical protein
MGRKQKLREEKRKIKNDPPPTVAATTTTLKMTGTDNGKNGNNNNNTNTHGDGDPDKMFPISDCYVRGRTVANNSSGNNRNEVIVLLRQGAIKYGCIHSMQKLGELIARAGEAGGDFRFNHMAHPWLLEGAIRGSYTSILKLMRHIYDKARPHSTAALNEYWWKTHDTIYKWDNGTSSGGLGAGTLRRDVVEKYCAICVTEDSGTLTLQQCRGCSMYCYCSKECQTVHWEEYCHRNECKQLKILNKYHKPYAREIRDAVIRGETDIYPLEKLRYKLGLTRPNEEINPYCFNHAIARDDGTVWSGSTTDSPLGSSL